MNDKQSSHTRSEDMTKYTDDKSNNVSAPATQIVYPLTKEAARPGDEKSYFPGLWDSLFGARTAQTETQNMTPKETTLGGSTSGDLVHRYSGEPSYSSTIVPPVTRDVRPQYSKEPSDSSTILKKTREVVQQWAQANYLHEQEVKLFVEPTIVWSSSRATGIPKEQSSTVKVPEILSI